MRLRVTHSVLVLLCLMYFITYLDRVNVSTAAAGFGQDFHLNRTQIGLVFSAFAYPYLVFQIIGGWLSDRFGARQTLIVCGLVWASATVLTGLADGLASLLAARLVLGFGEGATFPAATTAMSRWVAADRRGFAQGITHAAARVGNAAAPAVVATIMATRGWRASFFICACASFAWVITWMFSFTEYPKDHPRITPAELASVPQMQQQRTAVPWAPLFGRMANVTTVYFCYGWNLWLFLGWIPQYFLHSYNLDLKDSALFSSCVFSSGVLGNALGGVTTDALYRGTGNLRLARCWLVSACMFLTLLSLTPLMLMHSPVVSLVSLSAGFFFAEMTMGPMWSIPMDIAPEYSGTASGMMNTGSALAAIISPVVSGFLIDRFGNWELPFLGTIVLMGIGLVLALRMRPENRFAQAPALDR
jgi:ACS family glucarate transporter-like MFS transporter